MSSPVRPEPASSLSRARCLVATLALALAGAACEDAPAPGSPRPAPTNDDDDVGDRSRSECDDGASRPGCACQQVGATRSCDLAGSDGSDSCGGVMTCIETDDADGGAHWSECQPGGDTGGDSSCGCFSSGRWDIDNSRICGYELISGGVVTDSVFISSLQSTGQCPRIDTFPRQKPSGSWSNHRLTVGCAGTYTLCLTLRAGDYERPQASDCVLAKSCVDIDYRRAGEAQELPPLPGWLGDRACSRKYMDGGGYAEMSVHGRSAEGQQIGTAARPHVFQRLPQCPDNSCPGNIGGTF